jgi:hypothetical protein
MPLSTLSTRACPFPALGTVTGCSPGTQGLVFDKIVFNFPHIGGGTAEDADANKAMLAAFFKQVCTGFEPTPSSAGCCLFPHTYIYPGRIVVAVNPA